MPKVIALDQSTGETVWIGQVTSEVVAQPIANEDIVVVQTVDDKVTALDNVSGEQRWIYESTQPPLTLRGTSRPVFTPADTVVAGFSNGTLVSVSADDGVWRWEERVAVPEGRYDIDRVIDIDGDLVLDGNRIFASSYQGNLTSRWMLLRVGSSGASGTHQAITGLHRGLVTCTTVMMRATSWLCATAKTSCGAMKICSIAASLPRQPSVTMLLSPILKAMSI